MFILGINQGRCATAAILKDGQIIAAASEERFTRIKNQSGFPSRSLKFCLAEAGIKISDLDLIVFGARNNLPAVWLRRSKDSRAQAFRDLEQTFGDFISEIAKFVPVVLQIYGSLY